MKLLYILNESKADFVAGDVTLFGSLESLVRGVEAIDVMNEEFFSYTTDGSRVRLHANHEYDKVTVDVVNDPDAANHAMEILRQHLRHLSSTKKFGDVLNRGAIDRAIDIQELVFMIPNEAIVNH